MGTDSKSYLVGYGRPLPGLSADQAESLLASAGCERRYIDRPDAKGRVGWMVRDAALAASALRPGDLLVIPRLAALAGTREDFEALWKGLEARGVEVVSLQDGIDPRSGAGASAILIALGKAVMRRDRDWRSQKGQPAKTMKRMGRKAQVAKGGRPSFIERISPEVVALKCKEGLSWAKIAERLNVSESTCRRAYRSAVKTEKK